MLLCNCGEIQLFSVIHIGCKTLIGLYEVGSIIGSAWLRGELMESGGQDIGYLIHG